MGGPIDKRSKRFARSFRGYPTLPYFARPNTNPQMQYLTVIMIMMIYTKHVRNSLLGENSNRKCNNFKAHTEKLVTGELESILLGGGMQFWCDGNGRGLGGREKTRIPSASKGLFKIRHLICLSQFLSHYLISRYVVREQKISLNVSSKFT